MDSLTIIFILNGVFFISFFLLKNIYVPLGLSLVTLFTLLFVFKKKNISSIPFGFQLPSINLDKSHYTTALICFVIFFVLQRLIGFDSALLVTFFIFAHLNKLDSRISFYAVLIIFVITAFLAAGGNTRAAEPLAILAYYLLIIGVVWQIIEYIREGPDMNIVKEEIEQETPAEFISRRKSYNNVNFVVNYKIILIGVSILSFLGILFFIIFKKPFDGKKNAIAPTIVPIISVIPTPFTHVPFTILNATGIRGFAGSSAATLRKAGWDKEFDFTVGNYDGTASANMLRYTVSLEKKVKLLESDLKIQITPIIIKDATREAEMTLVLGK